MAVVVRTYEAFRLTVSKRAETEWLLKRYVETGNFVYLGHSSTKWPRWSSRSKRRTGHALGKCTKFVRVLYDRETLAAALDLKVWMLKAGVLEVLLYGSSTYELNKTDQLQEAAHDKSPTPTAVYHTTPKAHAQLSILRERSRADGVWERQRGIPEMKAILCWTR